MGKTLERNENWLKIDSNYLIVINKQNPPPKKIYPIEWRTQPVKEQNSKISTKRKKLRKTAKKASSAG